VFFVNYKIGHHGAKTDNDSSKVIDLMVSIDFVLRTCAQSAVVKV
jgi:hypothetical protein